MKNKIIQLFLFLLVFSLLVSSVSAFERSSQFLMPYLVDGWIGYEYKELQEKLQIPHVQVCIKNTRTTYEKCVESNDKGYFLVDLRSMLVNYPSEMSYMYGDIIEVWINKDDIRPFQIGGKEMCERANGIDCNLKAKAGGGHPVNFDVAPQDIIIYKGEEMEAKSWYEKFRESPISEIVAGILILVLTILAIRYHWGKGFYYLCKYYIDKKDFKRALKMMRTALKRDASGYYKK